jgi:hypothetical protein
MYEMFIVSLMGAAIFSLMAGSSRTFSELPPKSLSRFEFDSRVPPPLSHPWLYKKPPSQVASPVMMHLL